MSRHCAKRAANPGRSMPDLRATAQAGVLSLLLLSLGACRSLPESSAVQVAPSVPAPEPAAATEQFERALTLLGAGDVAMAVTELELLASSYPEYSGPVLNLGIAYAKAGQLPQAEQAFKMAIARKPDSAEAYNQLGVVYRKLGRFTEASDAYQRALEIQPGYAFAHLNLGVLYDMYLQQPEKALVEYEAYASLTGASDAVVNGWIKEIRSRLGGAARAAKGEA